MDVRSLVPSVDKEKYYLDQIETDYPTSDEEEYDIIFYINPKLLEQLTGGSGIRASSAYSKTVTVNKISYTS